MKTEKEHKPRMTPGTYYVWCGGSCDYAQEERCSGGAYIMQKDNEAIDFETANNEPTRVCSVGILSLLGIAR